MRRVNAKTIFYLLGLLAALAYLSYSLTTAGPRSPGEKGDRKPAATETQATEPRDAARLVQAAPADADFSRYQVILSRNIFSPPAPPLPPPAKLIIPPPLVLKPGDEKPAPPPPPTAPSLNNWSYVGYVTVDGATLGLIQNDETKSIKELKLGENFQGYKVEVISREEMALNFGATKVSLKRPLDFPLVPLEGTAGGGATPGGRPGGRRGGPGGGPGPGQGGGPPGQQ